MAISRERLEELIKEEATIYEAKYGNINPVSLKNKIRCVFKKHPIISFEPRLDEKYQHNKYFDKLFETKEDAEWFLEFGNITRTEKLELPTWEEFKNSNETWWFTDMKRNNYAFVCQDNQIVISQKERLNGQVWEATKENYIKACRIVKKLFMGDERDE